MMKKCLFLLLICGGFCLPVDAQDLPISQIMIDGEGWELLSEGHQFTEGPAVNHKGEVFFTDVPTSEIFKIALDGKVTLFSEQANQTAGLIFGADGKLYGTSIGGKAIVQFDNAGKPTAITEGVNCNDLVVLADGDVFFTDHVDGKIWHVSPDGKLKEVAAGIAFPNGVIAWPDQRQLVVSDMKGASLWNFVIAADGSLKHQQPYSTMQLPVGSTESGADGMTVDSIGRLYVCTTLGVQVFDTQGRLSGILSKPQRAFLSNVTFGGPEMNYLYATSKDKVYRRKLKTTGVRFTR
ncbi:MAG: SMP-30/gluconolactonase/LRE family protein [Pirellulales bacterium]|nr:hypothetical protein [Rhodopirellula sp.]MCH2369717.1 SMP-30/gluconolactonase/LRE family protein [Pirellulales bacterium]|tara:strand:- start:678 stop:1559 length:882 start_codon:yes stop_codon:yes gene_type:complete